MCNYIFEKYAGDKEQARRTGGAIYHTECGNKIYGLELTKGKCIYCKRDIKVDKKLDPLNRNFNENHSNR